MSTKILVVDDEPSARQTLENQLFPEGYTLQFAATGDAGLSQAHAWQPDVILCDVMMPGIDGFEFCRRIRADADLGQVPIILITALSDRQSKINGLEAGADDFISKPIDALELRARLRTLARLDRFRKLSEGHAHLENAHRELLQTHAALHASEARFRSLFETCSDAVFVLDQGTGRFVLANPAASELYGYSPEEFMQMGGPSVSAEPQKTSTAIHDQVAYVPERIHRRKDGSTFPVEIIGGYFTEGERKYHTAFIRDISGRKQAEQKLSESEERFRTFIEQSADGFMLSDEQGIIIEWNQALAQITGLGRAEALGMTMWGIQLQMAAPEKRSALNEEGLKRALLEILHDGASPLLGQVNDAQIQTRSGDRRFIQQTSFPIRTTQGYRMGAVVRDVTEQKRIAEALEAETERRRILFDQSPDGIVVVDPQTAGFLEFNTTAHAQLGYTREEFAGLRIFDLEAQETADDTRTRIGGVIQNGRADFETLQRTRQGETRNVHVTAQIVEITGQPVYYCTWRDITERKHAERALRESEARFNSAFRSSPIGIMVFELENGRCRDVNDTFLTMIGFTKAEVLGHSAAELGILPLEASLAWLQAFQTGNELSNIESYIRTKSGQMRYLIGSVKALEMEGETLGMLLVTDITARKQAEAMLMGANEILETRVRERTAELNRLNQTLEKALRARDEFMSVMSHELRTPLTGILGISEALQHGIGGALSEKQRQYVQAIEASGNRLLSIINNVLEFTSIQAGKLIIKQTPMQLSDICNVSLQEVSGSAQAKRQQVIFDITPETIELKGDEHYFRQILVNLLDNAIKFTPERGRILLSVTGLADEKLARISIADTGIGIEEENLPRLFQPFVQLDARLSREYEGTGLGLVLVKALVELHGGEISVHSVFGQGSTFTVMLPWKND